MRKTVLLLLTLITTFGYSQMQVDLPVTFDDTANVDYALGDFGGNASEIVADPAGGTNLVAKSTKTISAQTWAGTTVGDPNGFANPVPFTGSATKLTVRVYSPAAGIPVRLKVEDATNGAISVETEDTTTMANAWETLEFDFASVVVGNPINLANTYDKASIFFNFGTDGMSAGADSVYYWDDVEFIPDTTTSGGGSQSPYCETEVKHLGIPGEVASAINLTIANVDAVSMIVEIESANMDTVDFLLVPAASGAAIGPEDTSVPGKISRTLTWVTPPDTVSLNVLWSKVSFGGNWQLNPTDVKVPFNATCSPTSVVKVQVDVPITFDDTATVDYNLVDFGGNASEIVADPAGGTNLVVKSTKTATAQLWAGTTAGDAGLANPLPFSTNATSMTVRVYSPDANIPVRLKVEDAANGAISVETEAMTTMANAWETLTFDFNNNVSGTAAIDFNNTYDKASIFFNFGTDGATAGEKTYYWDDVEFVAGPPMKAMPDLPITFDDTANVNYDLVDFGGNASELVVDPMGGTNLVVKSTKTNAAQIWAGTTAGGGGLANPVPFTANATSMTVRVYAPATGIPVRLKVEDAANGALSVETEAMTTMANAWETLTFDFSSPATGTPALDLNNTYDKASIFFNFGTDGMSLGADSVYYWDDVEFIPDTTTATNDSLSQYCETEVKHLGIPGEVASAILLTIANVDSVTMIVEVESANADPVDLLIVNNGSGAMISAEDTVSVPGKRSRTLTWMTPPDSVTLNVLWSKASFGGNWQLSPMDITVPFAATCPPVEPSLDQVDLPVTFEDTTVDYALVDFGGNASELVADPVDPMNTVAKTTKTAAAMVWAGTTAGGDGFANPIPFTAIETKMSVMVYSPDAGIPVRLKAENVQDANIFVETEVMTTVANAWETLTFDFLNNVAGTPGLDLNQVYGKASLFFNFGTDGPTAGEKIYYWDNLEFVPDTSNLAQIDLPVTFEDSTVNYSLTDFGGNASELAADPVDPMNTVAKTTKTSAAMVWAGTTAGTPAGFANPIPFTLTETKMSVMVYSPDANIPVRLKVENVVDGSISVETEVMTTMANAWETLTFDFLNNVAGTAAFDVNQVYGKASLFFNFGTDGATAGEKVYFWDNLAFSPDTSNLAQIDLPVTFEDSTVDYTMVDFGGNASELVIDPVDPANHVMKSTKTDAAEVWAGTTAGTPAGFANAIPFTATETKMTVMVYSPDAGTPIRLKVENALMGSISVETEDTTTMANAWEMLEFDFTNNVDGTPALDLAQVYDKASIFFNFGTDGATAGEKTYHWDNLAFGGSVSIDDLNTIGFRYFPNPFKNALNVQATERIDNVRIMNMLGQTVIEANVSATQAVIDMSELKAGAYIMMVKAGDKAGTYKLIKR